MKKKILFLVNHEIVIYNFRKELVIELLEQGYDVIICSPNGEKIKKLIGLGCEFIEINIDRHGLNPFSDVAILYKYYKIINKIKPFAVLTYTIKPNIYGGIACSLKGIPYFVNITGLGNALEKIGFLRSLSIILYKISMRKVNKIFVQNSQIKDFFIENNISKKLSLIPGSGVNLKEFKLLPYPEEHDFVNILFIGRLMKAKGIVELLEAAKKLKNEKVKIKMIGFLDDNISNELFDSDNIEYLGFQSDVKKYIEECSAVILPSHHEGMANVLLEASACGRPVLGSNISGIKEIIDDGITGFLFEKESSDSIYNSIMEFNKLTYEKRQIMGLNARKKMEMLFDRNIIVNTYIKEIGGIKNDM
ncbi:glycosyltransferase family 4 protein [[Eubacterium] hominis]|uniref:glycosyltransferase family 4 protein n=1 Tax=[Eubacterium] hominis TaxID=2764325 RepID=UPI003A4E2B3C